MSNGSVKDGVFLSFDKVLEIGETENQHREGVVIRPLVEMTLNNSKIAFTTRGGRINGNSIGCIHKKAWPK